MTRVIGIDPGVQGAIAWTDGYGYHWERLYPARKSEPGRRTPPLDVEHPARRIAELVAEVDGDAAIYLEDLISKGHDNRWNVMHSGMRWGDLHRACVVTGARYVGTVAPRTWMARLGLRRLPEAKPARKLVLATHARGMVMATERELPTYLADGVLLAIYGRGDWAVRGAAMAREVRR